MTAKGRRGRASTKTTPPESRADEPVLDITDGTGAADAPAADIAPGLAASESDLAKLARARRAKLIRVGVLAVIAVALITFILQNARPVEMRLLLWTVNIRLIWLIVVSMVLGAVVGYLVGRPDKNVRLHGPNRRSDDTL